MNTTVWLISFTDLGEKVQKVHTHNCIADFRLLDPSATVQAIDCAAVAELIEKLDKYLDSSTLDARMDLIDALANIGGQP